MSRFNLEKAKVVMELGIWLHFIITSYRDQRRATAKDLYENLTASHWAKAHAWDVKPVLGSSRCLSGESADNVKV